MVRTKLVSISFGLLFAAGLTGCVSPAQHQAVLKAKATSDMRAQQFQQRASQLESERAELIARHRRALRDLEVQSRELEQRQTVDWDSFGVTGSNADGSLDLAGDLTFRSGHHELTKKGAATLKQVAVALKQSGVTQVRVEGHTDSDPLKASKARYQDNMHLSLMRAHAVCDALVAEGVDAKIISVVGHGQYRPKGKSKAENRRVEIFALVGDGANDKVAAR